MFELKNTTLLAASLLISLTAVTSIAAGRDGGGGFVVVCENQENVKPIDLLDHYQARRKMKLDLGKPSLSVDEKIELVLGRLEKLNSQRAKLYREYVRTFLSEVEFTDEDLTNLADTGGVSIPRGCKLELAVIQNKNPRPPIEDYRYKINEPLWRAMDNDTKAGLILHEVIYRELIHQTCPQQDSKTTRYFNGLVSSTQFADMKLRPYIELLATLGFEIGEAQMGLPISLLNSKGSKEERCNELSRGDLPQELTFHNDTFVKTAKTEIGVFTVDFH